MMKYLIALSILLVGLTSCQNTESAEGETTAPAVDLRKELAAMVKADQEIQQFIISSEDSLTMANRMPMKDSVFQENGVAVREIFTNHGFPDTSLVGEDGQHDFWLLVQHMDFDPEFQERVLNAMEPLAKQGAANAVDFAYLTDRVRLARGEKQLYGTQIMHLENMMAVPRPTADSLLLNSRRIAINMESIESYLNGYMEMHFEMNRAYYAEQGLNEPFRYEEL